MSPYYMRRDAGWKENLTAAAAALGAAATVFYFARILLAREPLGGTDNSERHADGRRAPDPREGNGH